MRELRGDLERVATQYAPDGTQFMAMSTSELRRALEELIAALDRRVPRVEQAGEAAIAREAAALRAKAIDRLTELAELAGETRSSTETRSSP